MLRVLGGAPTYLVTDDSRILTVDRGTGAPMRNPDFLVMGRYYGCQVLGCQPFAPGSAGARELTATIARDDLAPTTANLLAAYGSFAALTQACVLWCERMNHRTQRKTGTTPAARVAIERRQLHALPYRPSRERERVAVGAGARQQS
jgi:hypothetical protein